jgi:hypothetical protein
MEMKEFEYEISIHHLRRENRMRIFCSETGDCSVEDVTDSDSAALVSALNERGRSGWELVQILFGGDGFMCVWKRKSISEGKSS